MSAKLTTTPQAEPNIAFDFVKSLAAELSSGRVDLPSFPEIAIRVRRILSDAKSTIDQVVRVVGSEPALAARLMRISNSASLNRTGKPINDLRTAVNRIGYNMVRSASISFSMAQIRNSNKLAGLEHYLTDLWQRSITVAAFSYVIAKNCTRVNPDEAMLTGMMHGIGKLYVLTRAADHPELFARDATLSVIIRDWHASIGKAILENWDFSETMAQAVGNQDDFSRTDLVEADLCDVICVAILMTSFQKDPSGLALTLHDNEAAKRLGLDAASTATVLQDCADEVAALSDALGT